jgi:hypothetical protein
VVVDKKAHNFKWLYLNAPDPRFNYKASNWIKGDVLLWSDGLTTATKSILGKDGRDSDVYQSASNLGKLYSPGEFGFLPRPFANEEDDADSVVLNDQSDVTKLEDYDHMFRTVRLYDHGGTGTDQVHDKIYDYFTAENEDGTVLGARVNPLSNIPSVLYAAVEQMPVDYWYAAQTGLTADQVLETRFNHVLDTTDTWNLDLDGNTTAWGKFRKEWFLSVTNAVGAYGVNTTWQKV